MSLNLKESKKRESILDSLPIPMGRTLKERYRFVQSELDKREWTPLHELARENLEQLLAEIEKQLAAS